MKYVALIGNPNCGKTTLFNTLTGSTAHVGNWPGVTVEKKEGVYKKGSEPITIVDLPGIYSLSPYTPEEVVSRNYILDEKPTCVINIVDATNLERNLYLTTQLMEMDVPVVVALNFMDVIHKNGDVIDVKALQEKLNLPVVEISAQKEENMKELMEEVIKASNGKRKGVSVLSEGDLSHLVKDCTIAFKALKVDNPLFHAVKLIENDELEAKNHPSLVETVNEFKHTFKDDVFGNDLEAVVADGRYKYITKNLSPAKKKNIKNDKKTSYQIDKVLTNKWAGIPIFLFILFLIFHLTFSENFLFLGGLFKNVSPSFEGTMFEGLLWSSEGINSPGVILFNLVDCLTSSLGELVASLLSNSKIWVQSLIVDGVLAGIFSVLSFVPQILVLFLLFSILEDSGYMSRVAFILDKLFRKFGLSGRAFMPMIMGFGCSVPAMANTKTLADENERTATIRVIPFFSCGAKLPILTAISGAIITMTTGIKSADIITYSMYLLGIIVAIVCVLLMRKTTMKGEIPPFIMELPNYHLPQFKSLMLHLWDKLKHYIQKAFTIILASTIVIWFLSNFSFDYQCLIEERVINGETIIANFNMDDSILASIGSLVAPLFTPLGFGSNLHGYSWVFVCAAVTGLIAKENVIATFGTISACLVGATGIVASENGVAEVASMVQATNITIPALISFIAFNMLTIPCFAAVATAKGELSKNKFNWTILFWIVTSYIVSMMIYLIGTYWWTSFIFATLFALAILSIYLYNKRKIVKVK